MVRLEAFLWNMTLSFRGYDPSMYNFVKTLTFRVLSTIRFAYLSELFVKEFICSMMECLPCVSRTFRTSC